MLIRPITPELYAEVFALQNLVHLPYIRETMVVLTSKVYVSPKTCFAVQTEEGVRGYILALPWPENSIPSLTDSVDPQEESRNMVIHDCVVHPSSRRSGAAAKLIHTVENVSRRMGFTQISLAAVNGASAFWSRHGWRESGTALPEEYGEAVFMVKKLEPLDDGNSERI